MSPALVPTTPAPRRIGDGCHADLRMAPELRTPALRARLDRPLRRRLTRRVVRMLHAGGLHDVELSVLLTADEQIAALNQTYRAHQGPTDVLSFPQADRDLLQSWLRPARGRERVLERMLGDIVIDVPLVTRRSPASPAFEADLVDLLAHGVLHLLGHDHLDAASRRAMLSLQADLVGRCLGRGPVRLLDGML